MSERRCDCHELLLDDCERLRGATARHAEEAAAEAARRRRLLDSRVAWPAVYPGRCARCGEPFGPGTPLRAFEAALLDGTAYVAACCLDEHGEVNTPR